MVEMSSCMEFMNEQLVVNQKNSCLTLLMEFTEKGNIQSLGVHEFTLMPRIGEKISKSQSNDLQIYEVVDILYTDEQAEVVAEVYVLNIGDSQDYLAGLKWKMKSANR
jgi:hypothetical protein